MADTKRYGFVGLIVEKRTVTAPRVNAVLTTFGDLILARTGLPHLREDISVITLVVEATTDEIGALSGKLGSIPGVTVKTALAPSREERTEK
jgi:putative iron-only hydrogenase system regulator